MKITKKFKKIRGNYNKFLLTVCQPEHQQKTNSNYENWSQKFTFFLYFWIFVESRSRFTIYFLSDFSHNFELQNVILLFQLSGKRKREENFKMFQFFVDIYIYLIIYIFSRMNFQPSNEMFSNVIKIHVFQLSILSSISIHIEAHFESILSILLLNNVVRDTK